MQIKTMFISLYTWPQRTGSNLNVKKIGEKIKKKKNTESAISKFTCLSIIYFYMYIWKESKSIHQEAKSNRMLEIWVGFSTSFLLIFIY